MRYAFAGCVLFCACILGCLSGCTPSPAAVGEKAAKALSLRSDDGAFLSDREELSQLALAWPSKGADTSLRNRLIVKLLPVEDADTANRLFEVLDTPGSMANEEASVRELVLARLQASLALATSRVVELDAASARLTSAIAAANCTPEAGEAYAGALLARAAIQYAHRNEAALRADADAAGACAGIISNPAIAGEAEFWIVLADELAGDVGNLSTRLEAAFSAIDIADMPGGTSGNALRAELVRAYADMGGLGPAAKRLHDGKKLCELVGWETLACSRSRVILSDARTTWLDYQGFRALAILGELPTPADVTSGEVALDRLAVENLAIEILLGMEEPELAGKFAASNVHRVGPLAGDWPGLLRAATTLEATAAQVAADKSGKKGVRAESISTLEALLQSSGDDLAPLDAASLHVLLSEWQMDEAYDAAHHYVGDEFDYAASSGQVQAALDEARAAQVILKTSSYYDLSLRADAAALLARLHQRRIGERARETVADLPDGRLAIYEETNEPLMRAMTGRRRIVLTERFAHFALLWTDWAQAVSFVDHARAELNSRPENVGRALDNEFVPIRVRLADDRALGLAGVFAGWGGDSSIRDGFLATQEMFSLGAGESVRLQIAAADADKSRVREILGEIQAFVADRRMILSSAAMKERVRLADILSDLYAVEDQLDVEYGKLLEVLPEDIQLETYTLPDRYGVVDHLREGEAFVQIVNGEDLVHVFVILPDRRMGWAFETREYAQICQLAGRMRRHLPDGGRYVCPPRWGKTGTDLDPDTSFDVDAAYQLYQLIFEPVMPAFDGVDTVIVAISGPLASVPLATLLEAPAPATAVTSEAEMRKLPWLAKRFSFVVTPDAETFVRLRTEDEARRQGRAPSKGAIALIGAPCLGYERELGCPELSSRSDAAGKLMRGGANLSNLDPLPGAREELDELARQGKGGVLEIVGAKATEQAVRRADLGDFEKVFISTHVLTAGETGAHESGFVFSQDQNLQDPPRDNDGFLSESELLAGKLNLNADLVVVAGCNSAMPAASGGYYALPSLSGLAKAIMANGARQLILTQSPLDDRTSLKFTSALAAADGDYHKVLRRVMLDQIESGDPYPENWASFIAVGY